MTVADVGIRRILMAFLATVLLFGAMSAIANHSAEAAYPGGSGWIVFENNSAGPSDLWAVPADGSAAPVNLTSSAWFQADPVFSPDGTKLAFASNHEGESSIYIATFDPSGPSINAIGSWTRVSSGGIDGEPTWSPDGSTIAFERWFDFTIEGVADAASATVLTDNAAETGPPVVPAATFFSSGVVPERAITFLPGLPGEWSTTVASIGSETELTIVEVPTKTIAVDDTYSISASHARIMTAAANGSDAGSETQLGGVTSTPSYTDRFPAWDPTGALIAVVSTRNYQVNEANSDIYTFTTAGASPTNLTDDGVTGIDNHATWPSWSPDGDFVAFSTGEPNTADANLWRVNRAGTAVAQVTSAVVDDTQPAWSPDGTQIAYVASGAIYKVASGGGTGVAVTTAGTPANGHYAPTWQPALTGVADAAAVAEHGSVNVDVLANDLGLNTTHFGALASSATLVAAPTKGTATRQPDGTFTYEHTGPEIGTSATTDTFEYTVTQGSFSSTAVVTITINPVDDDPTADDDGPYAVSHSQTINVSAAEGVLVGDADPEGLGLSAVLVTDATKGTLSLSANGSFTYTHDGASTDATTDTFTYQAKDAGDNLSNVATVTISIGAEDPDPPVVTVTGDEFGAIGYPAMFNATKTDGSGPWNFTWSVTVNGTEIGTGTTDTLEFEPTVTGLHVVTVTVTDDAGTDTDSMEMTVLTDVTGHLFVNQIVWLANAGITKGCNPPVNDEFCPDQFVTRGQMASFIVRALDLSDAGSGDLFTDDDGSVHERNIDILATAGITKGCNPPTNTLYCPNDYVTREQMASFMVRALGLTDSGTGDLFVDDDGSIHETNIDRFATAGITRGCNPPDNTEFCPTEYVTRGQMAAFIQRATDYVLKN